MQPHEFWRIFKTNYQKMSKFKNISMKNSSLRKSSKVDVIKDHMSLFGITNICRGQKFMHFGISIGFYKLYNLPQNFL